MEKVLLKVGDVVQIMAGHTVYAMLPSRFVFANRRDSDELAKTAVKIGKVLDDTKGNNFDTHLLTGRYVVTETSFGGGGNQLSMSGRTENWPDGHCVVVQRLAEDGSYDPEGRVLSFYQTGSFTAMVSPGEIGVVGKMRRTFVPDNS